jgi:hypothetical protein
MDTFDTILRADSRDEENPVPYPSPHVRRPSINPQQPLPYSQFQPPVGRPPSEAPTWLKRWYSQQSFRQITAFIIMIAVLTICSVGWFNQILSSDQMLGVCSSILMLSAPSPFQTKKTKYVVGAYPSN